MQQLRNNIYGGNLLALTVSIYRAFLSLKMKFLIFQEDSNLFLLLNLQIKEEIEVHSRKLKLIWHFRNDHRQFDVNPFMKKKIEFNSKSDAAIEMYLSRLEK